MFIILFRIVLVTLLAGCSTYSANRHDHSSVVLWADGKPAVKIVLAANPTIAEQTAAQELADYLEKSSGLKFVVTRESDISRPGPGIYIGPTAQAKVKGLDASSWGPEQWAMRKSGGDLLLLGGRPRGTLYAVYHFLEDIVGVRWWNPFAEYVPRRKALEIGALNRKGRPRFAYRSINHLYSNDDGVFAARNRLNGDGFDPVISPSYGSGIYFGPPLGVHTFYLYIPPKNYFAEHPEWYSLLNGKRSSDEAQLCLTNNGLRDEVTRKLRKFIENSRIEALKAGRLPPVDFDISQNDYWNKMCECPICSDLTQREGSPSAPLIAFLNSIADAIATDYPDIRINTLAYFQTENPPKTLRPRDNIQPRLCDTNSNLLQPITHADNRPFAKRLTRWGQIAKNLQIWDYAVTYGPYPGLPLPTAQTYASTYRYFAKHNVNGVFTENEYPILSDMRDFKIWIMMKLLEDPYLDYKTLVLDFTDGFYGPAGKYIRTYLIDLQASAKRTNSSVIGFHPELTQYRYLTSNFLRQAQETFDAAEKSVATDPTLLPRVRHARLPLDRACLVLWPTLISEWTTAGGLPVRFPLSHSAIYKRVRQTLYTQLVHRFPEDQHAAQKSLADEELGALAGKD